MKLYGNPVTCTECGSDNVVERWRREMMQSGIESEYPVVACLTCGHERSL